MGKGWPLCPSWKASFVKHITYADKSLLIGDETADTLIKYAAVLTQNGTADSVEAKAISSDGDNVIATFLLGPGAPLMAETAHTALPEPDNTEVTAYMQDRIDTLGHAPTGNALDPDDAAEYVEDYTPSNAEGPSD